MADGDAYEVLARKYRPRDFDALIGQEAMVRVLRNAFERGRIHHAYVLTGVRGVGKTTTARIVAKGLNCETGPTVEPCNACEHCEAIAEGRHVDVIEMDAASNTGVDDAREIIEAVRYRPAMARYKVFIIDETHMLSRNAFNALLKTLEEPPAHVKFLFATTEIAKMPVTVLSRCQRFDLRRVPPDRLIAHLKEIAEKEGAEIEDGALALIARAAEGSVRDALSLLDQALAEGGGDAASVRTMLGLADRGRVLALLGTVMRGEAREALLDLRDQDRSGADPRAVLAELAASAHWVSALKVAPELAEDPALDEGAAGEAKALADALSMRALARAWQMLLKIIEEADRAPDPRMAAEMGIIRLCAAADLPTPDELVRRLEGAPAGVAPASTAPASTAPAGAGSDGGASAGPPPAAPVAVIQGGGAQARGAQPRAVAPPAPEAPGEALPANFEALVALVREKRDGVLLADIRRGVRLISYAPGRLEFAPAEGADHTLAGRLVQALGRWTGTRWVVTVGEGPGQPTLAEVEEGAQRDLDARVSGHPMLRAALEAWPGADWRAIPRSVAAPEPELAPDAPLVDPDLED